MYRQQQPWLALAPRIEFGDAQSSEQFVTMLHSFDPDHGVRAVMEHAMRETLEACCPERMPQYLAMLAATPEVSPFSFRPLSAHALLFFRVATLAEPGLSLLESAHRQVMRGMEHGSKGILLSMALRAAGGSLSEFLELTMRDQPFQNFGQRSLHRLGPRAYELVVTNDYPLWTECVVPPFMRWLFGHYGVAGELEFDALGPRSCAITVRWG